MDAETSDVEYPCTLEGLQFRKGDQVVSAKNQMQQSPTESNYILIYRPTGANKRLGNIKPDIE